MSVADEEADSVRVILRFRPINKREQEEFGDKENKVKITFNSEKDLTITMPGQPLKSYTFDRVFPPVSQQVDVYESSARKSIDLVLQEVEVSRMRNGCPRAPAKCCILCGYNAGQTGAGKSFTMFGPRIGDDKLAGVIPRAAKHVFQGVQSMDLQSWKVECSFLELYNEEIRDLLSQAKNLQIHEGKDGIYVDGSESVDCFEQTHVLELLVTGETHRATSATRMNEVSSRSHSIFILKVSQTDKTGRTLHGSEKIKKTEATGSRLEEAKKINLSLTALGKCIHALTNGEAHVPFRESKLTRLLQESLGGNTKTTLLIAASPHEFNIEETISTAKKIALNVHVNKVYSIEELQEIIVRMKEERALLIFRIKTLENEIAWMKSADYKPGTAPPPVANAPPGFDKFLSGELTITAEAPTSGGSVSAAAVSSTSGNTSPTTAAPVNHSHTIAQLERSLSGITAPVSSDVVQLKSELNDLENERDDLQSELWEKTEALENANIKIAQFEEQLVDALASKDDEIRDRDDRIEELTEQQHALTGRLEGMTKESSRVSEQVASLQIMVKDRDELEIMAQEMQKENDGLVDDLMTKEKELQSAKEVINEHKKKLKQKEREVSKLEEELKKTQNDMATVEMKGQEDMEYILEELNNLNVRNAELEERLKQSATAEEVKTGNYHSVDKAVSEQLQKLQRDIEAKEREKAKIEKSYESKLESLQEKYKAVKNDLEALDQANQGLEEQVLEAEAEKDKARAEVDELTKKQAQMSTRFGAAQMNIKRLEADIHNLQEKISKDSTERVDILNSNLRLETDLMKTKLVVQQKTRQADSLQTELAELKSEISSIRAERNAMKQEMAVKDEKTQKLTSHLAEAKKLIADLEAECEQLARKRGVVWSRRVVGDPFRDKVDFRNFKLRETNSKFTADARKEAELADRDFNDRMKKMVQSIDPTAQAAMSFAF